MVSTRGRYAIRVMIDLVESNNGHYIPLKDIAKGQEISKKYLEIIIKEMVVGELLIGASGRGGGYKLRRKPEEYTVGEILDLMKGALSSVACLASKSFDCPREDKCKTLSMWTEYDNLVYDFFYGKTILNLVNN